jgi:hypothetical protein
VAQNELPITRFPEAAVSEESPISQTKERHANGLLHNNGSHGVHSYVAFPPMGRLDTTAETLRPLEKFPLGVSHSCRQAVLGSNSGWVSGQASSPIIILSVVLYGCETWSLTPRGEHRLILLENRMTRRIFASRTYEVAGGWRRYGMTSFKTCTLH